MKLKDIETELNGADLTWSLDDDGDISLHSAPKLDGLPKFLHLIDICRMYTACSGRPIEIIEPGLEQNCATCRYSYAEGVEKVTQAICRRDPPLVGPDGMSRTPIIEVTWWCGAYEPRLMRTDDEEVLSPEPVATVAGDTQRH